MESVGNMYDQGQLDNLGDAINFLCEIKEKHSNGIKTNGDCEKMANVVNELAALENQEIDKLSFDMIIL